MNRILPTNRSHPKLLDPPVFTGMLRGLRDHEWITASQMGSFRGIENGKAFFDVYHFEADLIRTDLNLQ